MISRQDVAKLLDVSTQTVTNWAKKGIINGHMVGNVMMFDRNSIEQYFDNLQELDHMQKKIAEETEYIRNEDSKLKYEIQDILETRKGYNDAPNGAYRHISEYAISHSYEMFTENQKKVIQGMTGFFSMDPKTIAEKMGTSRSRVVEIFFQSIRKMMDTINLIEDRDKWEKMEAENKRLNQLTTTLMQDLEECKSQLESMTKIEEPKTESEIRTKLLCTPVIDLGFNVRAQNILKSIGCKTIGEVASIKKEELMRINKCGRATVENIEKVLCEKGLSLDSNLGLLLQVPSK